MDNGKRLLGLAIPCWREVGKPVFICSGIERTLALGWNRMHGKVFACSEFALGSVWIGLVWIPVLGH